MGVALEDSIETALLVAHNESFVAVTFPAPVAFVIVTAVVTTLSHLKLAVGLVFVVASPYAVDVFVLF